MTDLDELMQNWSDSLRLTNAFYSLYKQYRERTDSYESQIIDRLDKPPLSEKDWAGLKRRLEKKSE